MENNQVEVTVRHGKLRGIVEENISGGSFFAFRGIPYAKPPIGELRFQDPVPPESWSDVRDATKFGNISIQPKSSFVTGEVIGDEDCLFLNVYTTNIEPRQKRAVMVWIHGGNFLTGSGNHDIYGPDYIVQKNVVLVTINYRLGVFGFLNLGHEIAAGNQGLKDTVMALKWIQENILVFGGDPGNVTICGQSVGGIIVHYLATCPLAEGLFHKAISQSGTATNTLIFNDTPTTVSFLLAAKLGKWTTDPIIASEFLKTIDAKKIIETSNNTFRTSVEKINFLELFVPSLDDKSNNPFFLDHRTVTSREVNVPFILGFTNCEGSLITTRITSSNYPEMNSDFEKVLHPKFLARLKQQSITVDDLRTLYFDNKPLSNNTLINLVHLFGDMHFYRNTYETAQIQMQMDNRLTYMYQFSYENEDWSYKKMKNITIPGATHGEELYYLFHAHKANDFGMKPPKRDSTEYRIIDIMTQLWTDFAKTGNPTPSITDLTPVKWVPLQKGNAYHYLDISAKLQMTTVLKEELSCNWKNMKL